MRRAHVLLQRAGPRTSAVGSVGGAWPAARGGARPGPWPALAATLRRSSTAAAPDGGAGKAAPWTQNAVFRFGPHMPIERSYASALKTELGVVVVGGSSQSHGFYNSTSFLDAAFALTEGPEMKRCRDGAAVVSLDLDRVLVVGGCDGDRVQKSGLVLSLSTNTFTQGPKLRLRRWLAAAVQLDADRILVLGGESESNSEGDKTDVYASTEVLEVDKFEFAEGPRMLTPRYGCAVVKLGGDHAMVFGGHSGDSELNSTEILNVKNMTFSHGPDMLSPRHLCQAVPIDSQHVLVLGGIDDQGETLCTTEVFNVDKMTFTPGPTMLTRRYAFTAARVDFEEKPRIFVMGGNSPPDEELDPESVGLDEEDIYLTTTEILSLDAAHFIATDPPPSPKKEPRLSPVEAQGIKEALAAMSASEAARAAVIASQAARAAKDASRTDVSDAARAADFMFQAFRAADASEAARAAKVGHSKTAPSTEDDSQAAQDTEDEWDDWEDDQTAPKAPGE